MKFNIQKVPLNFRDTARRRGFRFVSEHTSDTYTGRRALCRVLADIKAQQGLDVIYNTRRVDGRYVMSVAFRDMPLACLFQLRLSRNALSITNN